MCQELTWFALEPCKEAEAREESIRMGSAGAPIPTHIEKVTILCSLFSIQAKNNDYSNFKIGTGLPCVAVEVAV